MLRLEHASFGHDRQGKAPATEAFRPVWAPDLGLLRTANEYRLGIDRNELAALARGYHASLASPDLKSCDRSPAVLSAGELR
jgi:hypothetical protein